MKSLFKKKIDGVPLTSKDHTYENMLPRARSALDWVQENLENGVFEHVESMAAAAEKRTLPRGFNMAWAGVDIAAMADADHACTVDSKVRQDCGSCRCIGGWMALHLGEHADDIVHGEDSQSPLHALFFAYGTEVSMVDITPGMAVRAIKNYKRGASQPFAGV